MHNFHQLPWSLPWRTQSWEADSRWIKRPQGANRHDKLTVAAQFPSSNTDNVELIDYQRNYHPLIHYYHCSWSFWFIFLYRHQCHQVSLSEHFDSHIFIMLINVNRAHLIIDIISIVLRYIIKITNDVFFKCFCFIFQLTEDSDWTSTGRNTVANVRGTNDMTTPYIHNWKSGRGPNNGTCHFWTRALKCWHMLAHMLSHTSGCYLATLHSNLK